MEKIIHELKHHAPFTALATVIAIVLVFVIHNLLNQKIDEELFHVFHFLHIIASAMVTAAIFYKYKNNFVLAFSIGILGAIIIGSISDVVFPYLGWITLNLDIHFHLPLLEETVMVLLFASFGSLLGIFIKLTKYPHFIHVFLSVFASLFYIIIFAAIPSLAYLFGAFFVIFIAVIMPCCLSDIVFPFLFLKNKK